MWPGAVAETQPDKPAYIMASTGQVVTYRELDDRSNRLAQLLYAAGLRFGDHIAICMENHPRYLEVAWAAQRSGLYFTPVNYHFNAEEIAYIADNCDAKAYITSSYMAATDAELLPLLPDTCTVRLMLDGASAGADGYDDYETAIAQFPAEPIEEELEGAAMMYSSGTTGRPKGIKYVNPKREIGAPGLPINERTVGVGRGITRIDLDRAREIGDRVFRTAGLAERGAAHVVGLRVVRVALDHIGQGRDVHLARALCVLFHHGDALRGGASAHRAAGGKAQGGQGKAQGRETANRWGEHLSLQLLYSTM